MFLYAQFFIKWVLCGDVAVNIWNINNSGMITWEENLVENLSQNTFRRVSKTFKTEVLGKRTLSPTVIGVGMLETLDLHTKAAEEPLLLPELDKASLDADSRINVKPMVSWKRHLDQARCWQTTWLHLSEPALKAEGWREPMAQKGAWCGLGQTGQEAEGGGEAVWVGVGCFCQQHSSSAWQCPEPGRGEASAHACSGISTQCPAPLHSTGLPLVKFWWGLSQNPSQLEGSWNHDNSPQLADDGRNYYKYRWI